MAEDVLLLHLQGSLGYYKGSWEQNTSQKYMATSFTLTDFQGSPRPLFDQYLVSDNVISNSFTVLQQQAQYLMHDRWYSKSWELGLKVSRHWTLTVFTPHSSSWRNICIFQTEVGFRVLRITFGTGSDWHRRHHSNLQLVMAKTSYHLATAFSNELFNDTFSLFTQTPR